MTTLETAEKGRFFSGDTWAWWEARRLRYNLTLGAAGWAAYGTVVALNYGFGHPVWLSWRGALGMTIFLGTAYLLVMGAANVCYLLGPAVEGWVKPADADRFRRRAYGMGLWGSLLVPFSFPLIQFAILLGSS